MLITHEREKLINVIIFFADHVQFLGKVKLFKLLYFLDFEHFRETGRSVTGMEYFAWKMGPVPVDLQEEIDAPEPDMCEKIRFEEVAVRNGVSMMKAVPLAAFDDAHFTGRELRLMRKLAEEFKTAKADDMVEATHLENLPWHRVYIEEGRKQQMIPYTYALKKQEEAILLPIIAERNALVKSLKSIGA
jgi:uncharacterized phage-associated protein